MSTYILILVIFFNGSTTSNNQEFKSEAACLKAKTTIIKEGLEYRKLAGFLAFGVCVENK
jgi:hypothetical protein